MSSRDWPFIPGSPLKYPPKPKQYCQLKALLRKKTLNMCSLDPSSCSSVTQACGVKRTHTLTCVHACVHAHIPPHFGTHSSHPHTTQESPLAPTHLMFPPRYVKTDVHNCAGVVCCFCAGGHQRPPRCLGRRWSQLQTPQIFTPRRFKGLIVETDSDAFRKTKKSLKLTYNVGITWI